MTGVLLRRAPETPPPAEPRRRPRRARSVVLVTLAALALTALLNANDLLRLAKHQPFGWQRDVAVRLATVNSDISSTLWLDRPRRGLDTLRSRWHGNAKQTVTPGPSPTSPTSQPSPGQSSVAPQPSTTPTPTAAHPLRIYYGGDSVAQAVTAAVERAVSGVRTVRFTAEFRFSTGLSRPDYFDWPGRLRSVLAGKNPPQVVVVMFGANDIQPIMTPSGPAHIGSAAWLTEYRKRVAATMDLLTHTSAQIYWVGQPLMRSSTFSHRISQVDDIYRAEAARHPGITFVDTRPTMADAQGHYAAYLPDSSGRLVLMRTPDGVHLTSAGGARIAHQLLGLIGPRWHLHLS